MPKVSDLRNDLIPVSKWNDLYEEMSFECKRVVDKSSDSIKRKEVGVGHNELLGWFTWSEEYPYLIQSERPCFLI